MIDGLILENFKAFGTRQHIPLAPITLIFGANSAGKSSIIQSLLLLRQSMDNLDSPEQAFLFKSDSVDLGSFRDTVFDHDLSRQIEISVMAANLDFRPFRSRLPDGIDISRRGIGVRYSGLSDSTAQVTFPIYIGLDKRPAFTLERSEIVDETRSSHIRNYQSYFVRRSEADPSKLFSVVPRTTADHPFWSVWFNAYRETVLPTAAELLNKLSEYLEDAENLEDGHSSISPTEVQILINELLMRSNSTERRPPRDEQKSREVARAFIEGQIKRIESYDFQDFLRAVFEQNSDDLAASIRNFSVEKLMLRREDPIDRLLDARTPYSLARLLDLPRPPRLPLLPDVDLLTEHTARVQRRFISNLKYLGPLRGYPERHYVAGGRSSRGVGRLGESSADVLFGNPDIADRVDDYIQRFGFGYRLKLAELVDKDQPDSQGGVFGVRLIDKVTGVNVSLVDVGFGVSQVLPVIVQSLLSKDSTIAIEQPEIHLHPALQAELAELFADSIKEPTSNRFIIETHSEHLILRFQRLVRRGLLDPDDLAVLYVSRPTGVEDEGARVTQLRIDDDGEFIDEWPGGFFEESFKEMFDI